MNSKPKILIIDDEKQMLDLLSMILEDKYQIITTSIGEKALQIFIDNNIDLCILDIMMPKMDGFQILKRLKQKDSSVPIIFISARTEAIDRIKGLELGADDFITKPFAPREVLARVQSVLRRTKKIEEELIFGKLTLQVSNRSAFVSNCELKLTPLEFDLLVVLCKNPNQAFSREQLLQKIWGYDYLGDARTIDTHIKNLRIKFKEIGFENPFQTVWGYGYRWVQK